MEKGRKLVCYDFAAFVKRLIRDGIAKPRNDGKTCMLMGRRISYILPAYYGSCLPRIFKGPKAGGKQDKYQRYRHRLLRAGKCPRCGKDKEGGDIYHYCDNCRHISRIRAGCERLVKCGEIKKVGPSLYSKL